MRVKTIVIATMTTMLAVSAAAQDAGAIDAGPQDATSSVDASMGPCAPDSMEPNNDSANAKPVSAGTISDLTSCDEFDWYSISVPANNGLVVDIAFIHEQADLDLYIYDAAATSSSIHSSLSLSDNERVFKELFETATNVLIKVKNFTFDDGKWAPYTMTIALYPGGYDPCAPDDSAEQNDDFASASRLAIGSSVNNLVSCDTDVYSFTVPANNGVVVDMSYPANGPNLDLALYEQGATGTSLHHDSGSDGAARVYWELFDSETTVFVRVPGSYNRSRRVSYSLTVTLYDGGYDPCGTDDSYEPNEEAASAATISVPGTIGNLIGCDAFDWYSFTLPANKQVEVTMDFVDANADLDLYIYDASDPETALDRSTGTTDQEVITVDAPCSDTPMLLKVRNYSFSSGGRSDYSLDIAFTDQDCTATDSDGGGSPEEDGGASSGSDAGSGTGFGGNDTGTTGGSGTNGCGCRSLGADPSGLLLLGLLGLVAVLRRRQSL